MRVVKHLLTGAAWRPSPNRQAGGLEPRWVVLHFTAGSYRGAVEWMAQETSKVSAHLVVSREGDVTQMGALLDRCWHAGESEWLGTKGLNAYSIGIEMANMGQLSPDLQRTLAAESIEIEGKVWHRYTDAQTAKVAELCLLLTREYGCKGILRHSDISPGRKTDPGPAWAHAEFAAWVKQQAVL